MWSLPAFEFLRDSCNATRNILSVIWMPCHDRVHVRVRGNLWIEIKNASAKRRRFIQLLQNVRFNGFQPVPNDLLDFVPIYLGELGGWHFFTSRSFPNMCYSQFYISYAVLQYSHESLKLHLNQQMELGIAVPFILWFNLTWKNLGQFAFPLLSRWSSALLLYV